MNKTKHLLSLTITALLILLLSACGAGSTPDPGDKKNADSDVSNHEDPPDSGISDYSVKLVSINIKFSTTTVNSGNSITATAFGDYSNGTKDVPLNYVTWIPTGNFTIDQNGVITAGDVTSNTAASLVASYDSTGSLSYPFMITPKPSIPVVSTLSSITLLPLPSSLLPLNQNESLQLSAIGNYNDGTSKNLTDTVVWSSANSAIASVVTGDISAGTQAGAVAILATMGNVSKAVNVQTLPTLASIQLSAPTTIRVGDPVNIQATGTYTDSTTQNINNSVVWTSSNINAITITKSGHVTVGDIGGSSTISVSLNGITATADINFVIPQTIRVDTVLNNLAPNSSTELVVSAVNGGTSIVDISDRVTSWTTDDSNIADILVASGSGLPDQVKTFSVVGSTIIYASAFGLVAQGNVSVVSSSSVTVSLRFDDISISMLPGKQYTPKIFATDGNGLERLVTQNITWQFVTPGVATIDANGVITSEFITTDEAISRLVATYQGKSASVNVRVTKPETYDYINYTVDSNSEVTHTENTTLINYPNIEAALSSSGVLADIPTKVLKPNYYFMTMTNPLSKEKFALGISNNAAGNYNKSNATIIFVKDKNNPEFYTLDTSINTSLTATVNDYGLIGGQSSGTFNAVLCKASAIDANTCAIAGNRINLAGNYSMSVENEKASTCYTAMDPKIIDAYTANSSQLICNGAAQSFYQLNTISGTNYEITATSPENISIMAEGVASVAGRVSFIATKSISDVSFNYTGASTNRAFRLDVTTLALGSEGSLNNPKTIAGNGIPISGTMIVDNTTSYYKLSASAGHRYILKFEGDKTQGAARLIISVSDNGLYDATNVCNTPIDCKIEASSGFVYVKLDGTVSGQASVDVTLNYQTDRDPSAYADALTVPYPVVGFTGQVGIPENNATTLQGSAYGITGLTANTNYIVKLSGIENFTRLWVNMWAGAIAAACNTNGDATFTDLYCFVRTSAFPPTGFTVSVTAGATGVKYLLDVSETTDTFYYISTFRNASWVSSAEDVNEIALYRDPYIAGQSKPFVVSATDSNPFTSNIFSAASGERIYMQVTDASSVGGNAYSIIVNSTGNTTTSVNTVSGPDSGEPGNNTAAGATVLTLDTQSDHTFINADGSLTNDQDWFTFTAP